MSREELRGKLRQRIVDRAISQFRNSPGRLRSDAAAWVLIAIGHDLEPRDLLDRVNVQLQSAQLEDGRVAVDPRFPDAAWPTPLAVLAWLRMADFKSSLHRAVQFLLHWQGLHWINERPQEIGHDTSLPGWPWISGTHSWIEPTALALVALRSAGKSEELRCVQARQMVLNRQLPSGGWNYGNTTIFKRELRPMPHSTGAALTALAGTASQNEVSRSLEYLKTMVSSIRAPLSLGWSLVGLAAWNVRVSEAASWVNECLELEKDLPEYDLPLLSLLYCALLPESENPLVAARS